MRLTLTRVVRFQASHHFGLPGRSPAENRARFGPVTEPHRHDFQCAVTVAGPVSPPDGMLLDLGALDALLGDEVGRLDGGDLNRLVPPFAAGAQQPTCEALAAWLFGRLAERLPAGVRLQRVEVSEGPELSGACEAGD